MMIARRTEDALAVLQSSDAELKRVARAARERVLAEHTASQRALEFVEALIASTEHQGRAGILPVPSEPMEELK